MYLFKVEIELFYPHQLEYIPNLRDPLIMCSEHRKTFENTVQYIGFLTPFSRNHCYQEMHP